MNRSDRRRCARNARSRARGRVDHDFIRLMARAHFVIEEAQRHGITFAIENGKLAVEYPLSIEPRFWRQLQDAILDNRQVIANFVYSRERGIL